MMRFAHFAFIAAMSPTCVYAAQTAEETAAYLIYSAEDKTSHDDVSFRQLRSDEGAEYDITFKDGKISHLKVTRDSDCVFRYRVSTPEMKIEALVDYTTAYEIRDTTIGLWEVRFSNTCGAKLGDECMDSIVSPYGGNIDRARNALTYLKKEFCEGNAF